MPTVVPTGAIDVISIINVVIYITAAFITIVQWSSPCLDVMLLIFRPIADNGLNHLVIQVCQNLLTMKRNGR